MEKKSLKTAPPVLSNSFFPYLILNKRNIRGIRYGKKEFENSAAGIIGFAAGN